MSRPMNMLRTRRKDCNVKPNRRGAKPARLDRKSSRGMLYENEELRLKTININAEVESRQSDIKKLKRENEMLKKGLWYLRDEYDKLERLIKDKKLDFYSSSSTTCTSSSSEEESCSSCGEESEEVETTQNIKNVQRTNLRNIKDQFDHLSVVTEETSAENSEQNSNRASLPKESWNYDKDVIKPDQSYPEFKGMGKSQTLPVQDRAPPNFFSSIQTSKSFDENQFNQVRDDALDGAPYLGNPLVQRPNDLGTNFQQFQSTCDTFLSQKIVQTNANNFYQNMVLVPKSTMPQPETRSMEKASTDLIVKIDNQNFSNNALVFSNTPSQSQSTFSNGGNLEELLNDIESISQEILKLSNLQRGINQNVQENDANAAQQDDAKRFILEVQSEEFSYLQNPILDNPVPDNSQHVPMTPEKPYKSELNVVLMPNPMPLIGFDKYRNIQRSLESLNAKPVEEMSASQQNLRVVPPPPLPLPPAVGVSPNLPPPPAIFLEEPGLRGACEEAETNPFFFGNLKDNYVNADYFNMRYNPDNFAPRETEEKKDKGYDPKSGSKTNLLDLTSSEHVSSENEENLKFKTSKPDKPDEKKPDQHRQEAKLPKLSIRRKVSIHFKGKKEKAKKLSGADSTPESPKPRTPGEKKGSIFDIRFGDKDKEKARAPYQKTPSVESRMSTTETSNPEPKTPTSTDSRTSNEKRNLRREDSACDKKNRKSVSVSPDRNRHVHLKEEGGKKHKKHKKSDRGRARRPSAAVDPRNFRERSFSVCTDRSNILEHRLGLGLGSSYLYDEYSDRERTNSLSSCETSENARKLSTMSNVPLSGKVPWCGCWGNGCL
ncbi:uncharacterized protein LOC108904616 isoform X2 [Anoplophora glabripennis]|uniref:uncharacterized protein LOC108904616 isoform X2 n=1 Tax=Anoplophora glabripennis TaxID=217634 RepID=UPI0008743DBE|nr:uncharacterized protein LOC108904616 isoform X2 [Anoplophora glabripennis]